MKKYTMKWNDTRTVWSEVHAISEKDAIKKVLAGKGQEVDWNGSDHPESESDITEVFEEKEE